MTPFYLPAVDATATVSIVTDFDVRGLYAALDTERVARGLTWPGLADDIWALSDGLNARRQDHPISPSTLRWTDDRLGVSCQHALFMLRWLGRSPEDYMPGAVPTTMPDPGPYRRLRWNLTSLADAVDEHRHELGLTWPDVAREVGCTPSQISSLRSRRFGVGISVAMRIVAWLGRPSTDFIVATRW